jgi:crotonyl-CoA carboxylase/reductase
VVFVPVALNYDRVMEDRNLIEAQANGARAFRFSLRPIYRYLRRQTWLRLTGKFHRYGYAAVCFGDPLSLTEFLGVSRPDQPAARGGELMARIARAMPVTPVPLVCHALVNGAHSRAELEQSVAARIAAARGSRRDHPHSARRPDLYRRGRLARPDGTPPPEYRTRGRSLELFRSRDAAWRSSTPSPYDAPEKDLYEIGRDAPDGLMCPKKMYAWAIRRERHGEPDKAFRSRWSTPGPRQPRGAGARDGRRRQLQRRLGRSRQPISPFDGTRRPYHIAGSDAAGIVWAVGDKVKNWKVGDEVVIHCNQDDGDDEECNGGDPMFSPTPADLGLRDARRLLRQFTRVQAQQLMPRPKHLTWEESACYTLTLATAYRMLFGHHPHELKPGQNVLVWGASGGLGVYAIQLANTAGANAIGVISDEDKRDFVMGLGAKGVINRKDFNCWGQLPKVNTPEYKEWFKEARKFGKAIWDITGKGVNVDMVFEHPGEATFPVSTLRVQEGRHGRDLRRHHRLQLHLRRALHVDAPEAPAGLAFRASQAGRLGQQADDRAPSRPLHVRGLPVG